MSKKQSPPPLRGKKFIQPRATVDARFGPIETVSTPDGGTSPQRRQRTILRGVVLRAHHTTGNWLVHWFTIGRTSHVSFSKIKVVASSTPSAVLRTQQLLRDNKDLYLGGTDELKDYCDIVLGERNKKRPADTTPVAVSSSPVKQSRPNRPPPTLPTHASATEGKLTNQSFYDAVFLRQQHLLIMFVSFPLQSLPQEPPLLPTVLPQEPPLLLPTVLLQQEPPLLSTVLLQDPPLLPTVLPQDPPLLPNMLPL